MVNNGHLKEFYKDSISDALDYIKFKNEENKIFQRIRERYQKNWKIAEGCREIMFENAKTINFLREQIENDRRKIKEFG